MTANFLIILTVVSCLLIDQSLAGTVQAAGVKGRLVCGSKNEAGIKVKLVDVDRLGMIFEFH